MAKKKPPPSKPKKDLVQNLVDRCNKAIALFHVYLEDMEDPQEKAKLQKFIDAFSRDTALVAGGRFTGEIPPVLDEAGDLADEEEDTEE